MAVDPIMLVPWFVGGFLLCVVIVIEYNKEQKQRKIDKEIMENLNGTY